MEMHKAPSSNEPVRKEINETHCSRDLHEVKSKVIETPTAEKKDLQNSSLFSSNTSITEKPCKDFKTLIKMKKIDSLHTQYHDFNNNLCEVCGFSFVRIATKADGSSNLETLYTYKFKFNKERLDLILKVLPDFVQTESSKNGICRQCFRSIERIIKLNENAEQLRMTLRSSRTVAEKKIAHFTPEEEYGLHNDFCELCGISFVLISIGSNGTTNVTKLYEQKVKVNKHTKEKLGMITKALPEFQISDPSLNNGLCKKCYRVIEKIVKIEHEIDSLRSEVIWNRKAVLEGHICIPSKSKESYSMNVVPEESTRGSVIKNAQICDIMAQYRQIACKTSHSDISGICILSSGPVLNTYDPKSCWTSLEDKTVPLGRKRVSVDTSIGTCMSHGKNAKVEKEKKETVKIVENLGNTCHPLFIEHGTGNEPNGLFIPIKGNLLKVKLPTIPFKPTNSPTFVPVDMIEQPSCTNRKTENGTDSNLSSSGIIPVDVNHSSCISSRNRTTENGTDSNCSSLGIAPVDIRSVSCFNETSARNGTDIGLSTVLSEIKTEPSTYGYEEAVGSHGSSINDEGMVSGEMETGKKPVMIIVKSEDYKRNEVEPTTSKNDEDCPLCMEVEEHVSFCTTDNQDVNLEDISDGGSTAFCHSQEKETDINLSPCVPTIPEELATENQNKHKEEHGPRTTKYVSMQPVYSEEYGPHTTNVNMTKIEPLGNVEHLSRNPQGTVNSFVQLLASSSVMTGYQLFFQSHVFSEELNRTLHNMPFNYIIDHLDKKWDKLDQRSKELYESCAETINISKLKQPETSDRMDEHSRGTEAVLTKNTSSSTPCIDCKIKEHKLIQNKTRIKELEKELEEEREKNKELVKIALNKTVKTES